MAAAICLLANRLFAAYSLFNLHSFSHGLALAAMQLKAYLINLFAAYSLKLKRNKKEKQSMRLNLAPCQANNFISCIPRLKLFLFHGSSASRK